LGASYLTQDGTLGVAGNTGTDGIETERYTGGVVYTYGPGMTFRGSISHVEHDNVADLTGNNDSIDATSVLLGTQINF
jgi:outer membrane protein OmpU